MVDFLGRFKKPKRVGGDGDLTVFCASEQSGVVMDLACWQLLATDVLKAEGVRGAVEMSILFVESHVMAEMNSVHMGKSGPTDVLAFPIDAFVPEFASGPGSVSRGPDRAAENMEDSPLLLGDVVICPEVALAQAPTHAGTFDDEIALLVTHGLLHVLGYDHAEDDERARMQSREKELLELYFWKSPAPPNFRIDHSEDAQ